MLKIRTIYLSTLLSIVVATGTYFVVMAVPAASKTTPASSGYTCPVVHPTSLSEQDLRKILDGRYENRVNLPR